jgi:hypothetical protein
MKILMSVSISLDCIEFTYQDRPAHRVCIYLSGRVVRTRRSAKLDPLVLKLDKLVIRLRRPFFSFDGSSSTASRTIVMERTTDLPWSPLFSTLAFCAFSESRMRFSIWNSVFSRLLVDAPSRLPRYSLSISSGTESSEHNWRSRARTTVSRLWYFASSSYERKMCST